MLNPGLLAFPEAVAVGASSLSPSSGISNSFPSLILHSLPSSNLTGLPSASVFQGNSFSCPQQSTQTREANLTTASLAPIISPCSLSSKAQNSTPLCSFDVLSLNPAADSHPNKNGGQDEKPKLQSYGLQRGLEWKIVGVTSLSESFPKGMLIQSAAVTHNNQQQESPDVQQMPERSTSSRTAPGAVSPKGNEQWTIVGVTSLDQAVGFTGTLPLISSPTTLVSQTSAKTPAEPPTQEIYDTNSVGGGGVDAGVPLLPGDPSALCCQWKIAGITTLPVPTVITAPQANLPNSAVPQLVEDSPGSKASPYRVEEGPKWKVVGMTSISSEKLGDAPASPVPLVTMAAAGPLVSVPAAPASAVGEGAWKVVGVVPLPQTACAPNSQLASQSSGIVSCDPSCAPCSTLTSRKILPTTDMPKEVKALPHPLSFLKNCSNHFRNAVLKKNTVSTMLELKRAYEKRCRLGNKANPLFCQESSSQAANSQRCKGQCITDSFVSADDRTVLSELYHSQMLDQSQSTNHSESREPTGSYSEMTKQSPVSENQMPKSHEERGSLLGSSKHARQEQASSDDAEMLYDQWRVFKSEGNELVMAANGEGDGVHLAAVDPWGVCTDEDLDEIAEMMAERADKTPPSSSRKRKLSTPRKMVQ